MAQQERQDGMFSDRDTFNILYFALNAYAMALLPFLRRGMGRRGIGLPGLFALVIIVFYGGQTRSAEMTAYFWAWLTAVFVQRLTIDRRQHSLYQGWPVFTGWLAKDEMHARLGEVVLVFIVGTCLGSWSEAVGHFVTWGSVALMFKYGIEAVYFAREKEAFEDARIEMENRMQQTRQRR